MLQRCYFYFKDFLFQSLKNKLIFTFVHIQDKGFSWKKKKVLNRNSSLWVCFYLSYCTNILKWMNFCLFTLTSRRCVTKRVFLNQERIFNVNQKSKWDTTWYNIFITYKKKVKCLPRSITGIYESPWKHFLWLLCLKMPPENGTSGAPPYKLGYSVRIVFTSVFFFCALMPIQGCNKNIPEYKKTCLWNKLNF